MKYKVIAIMFSLLLTMPVLSFAEDKNLPEPNTSAYEKAYENAKFKSEEYLFLKQLNKEFREKKRAEKKAAKAEKKALRAKAKREKEANKNGLGPNLAAYEKANERAKFKRGQEIYDNKENKKIRAKELAEKEAANEEEIKKKFEEAHDKGEGQVKVKF